MGPIVSVTSIRPRLSGDPAANARSIVKFRGKPRYRDLSRDRQPRYTLFGRTCVSGTVVVICAYAFEARAMAGVCRQVSKDRWGPWTLYRGEMWDLPAAIVRCGPGKVAAAAAAQASVHYLDPAALVSFGVGAAMDPRVEIGTLMVAERVINLELNGVHDLPVAVPSDFLTEETLRSSLLSVPGTRSGTFLCWEGQFPSPLHRPDWEGDPSEAVIDWESAGVAQVADMWDLPWGAVRVVSDHGEPERLRMVAAVAKRPLQWAAETVRRACYSFLEDRVRTRDLPEGEAKQA